jgi:hypothetical protein
MDIVGMENNSDPLRIFERFPSETLERIAANFGGPWERQPAIGRMRATNQSQRRLWPARSPAEGLAVRCNRKRVPWRHLAQQTLDLDEHLCVGALVYLLDLTGRVIILPEEEMYLDGAAREHMGMEVDDPWDDVYERQGLWVGDVVNLLQAGKHRFLRALSAAVDKLDWYDVLRVCFELDGEKPDDPAIPVAGRAGFLLSPDANVDVDWGYDLNLLLAKAFVALGWANHVPYIVDNLAGQVTPEAARYFSAQGLGIGS